MKNTTRTNRNNQEVKIMTKLESLKRVVDSRPFRGKLRQASSLVVIYALVVVPLLTIEGVMRKASAATMISSGKSLAQENFVLGADYIFQDCAFGCGQVQTDLENGAIDDVISLYNLPPTDRSRVIGNARNEIRSMLYHRILALIKKPSPTAAEQAALNTFAGRIKGRRVLAAQKAQEEYNKWRQQACLPYVPPAPFTYNPGAACYSGLSGFLQDRKFQVLRSFNNSERLLPMQTFIRRKRKTFRLRRRNRSASWSEPAQQLSEALSDPQSVRLSPLAH